MCRRARERIQLKPRLQSSATIGVPVIWLLAAAGAVAISLRGGGIDQYPRLLAVGASFLVLTLLALRLPTGEVVRIDVLAATAALGVLAPLEGLISMAVGASMGRLLALKSQEDSLLGTLGSVARGVFSLGLAYACLDAIGFSGGPEFGVVRVVHALLAAGLYLAFDLATLGGQNALLDRGRLTRSYQSLLGSVALLSVGQACLGVALVLGYPYMGEWSVLVLTLLGAVLLNGFNLYLRVRVAYGETIRALARASELGMPERTGHASSVAEIASLAARELGMSSREIETLNYAALLHDIGLISARESGQDLPESDVGAVGARILEGIPFLTEAAELIRVQGGDSDPSGQSSRQAKALGGAIIRAASEFDMRMRAGGGRHGVQGVPTVLAEMRSNPDGRHIPQALDALARVVSSSPFLNNGYTSSHSEVELVPAEHDG
jgi:hypothetical protein